MSVLSRLGLRRRNRRSGAPLPAGSIVPGGPGQVAMLPSALAPADPLGWALPPVTEVRTEAPPPAQPAAAPPSVGPAEPTPSTPRVGLVFGDGTHVVLDPDDPQAGRFAALAEELNR